MSNEQKCNHWPFIIVVATATFFLGAALQKNTTRFKPFPDRVIGLQRLTAPGSDTSYCREKLWNEY
jgi:hypothetical protein